jgi:hypothetical protein
LRPFFLVKLRNPIGHIRFDAKVRKESEVLKDIAGVAFANWEFYALSRVEYHSTANADCSRIRGGESGDAVEQGGLAGSRRAKQDGDSWGHGKGDIQRKSCELFSEANLKAAGRGLLVRVRRFGDERVGERCIHIL